METKTHRLRRLLMVQAPNVSGRQWHRLEIDRGVHDRGERGMLPAVHLHPLTAGAANPGDSPREAGWSDSFWPQFL